MTIEQALLSFTVTAGLLTITPGLDTALVLRTAAVEGRKQAMLAGIGICFGCLLWGVAASFGGKRAARRFRVRLQRAPNRGRYLSGLFGNQIAYSRIRVHFFKQRCRTRGICQQGRLSMVQTWPVDEPSQPKGWRLLSELPAAIYSDGRPGLVVQHSACPNSCDRRASLVLTVNERD
jgi:hypothetical protein